MTPDKFFRKCVIPIKNNLFLDSTLQKWACVESF
jgi:hypothetical protein